MHIPRNELDAYGAALSTISAQAQSEIISAAKAIKDLPIEDARELLIGEFTRIEVKYGAAAAAEASGFFESLLPSKYPAPNIIEGIGDETIDSQVRSAMQFAVDGKQESLETRLAGSMDRYVKRSAREVPISAAKQYGKMIRYARVPSGRTTCSFCIMLASRGFVYHSGKSAGDMGKFHGNCDCYVVPGLADGTTVEGYDPDALYDTWDKARSSAGVKHDGELTAAEHKLISDELSRREAASVLKNLSYDNKVSLKARELLAEAKVYETVITADIKAAAEKAGSSLAGLDYRLKTIKSLERKLKLNGLDTPIRDTLRFTSLSNGDQLVRVYGRLLADLEAKGYNISAVKNYWVDSNSAYKGVNISLFNSSGYEFELQFHSPHNLEVKERMHKLYEQRRTLESVKDAQKISLIEIEMGSIAKDYIRPNGITLIENMRRGGQ